MNCRDFLNEFEERNALTESAMLHLNDCPDCEKTKGEQTRVWQMIDDLPRIAAPKDFDFRVKARIADSKPADFQPRFLPVLRYVLPLSVIVLLLGLVVFNTAYFSGDNAAPQVAETISPQTPVEKEVLLPNSSPPEQVAVANTNIETTVIDGSDVNFDPNKGIQDKQLRAEKSVPKSQTEGRKRNTKNDLLTSRDSTVSEPLVKFPLGIEPNQPIKTLPNPGNLKSISNEEILSLLGIEIVLENGNRKVKTVKQNSSAERSGVQVGDVIEAINGKKLSDEPTRNKTVEGKTLTIRRGGEKIEINLQN